MMKTALRSSINEFCSHCRCSILTSSPVYKRKFVNIQNTGDDHSSFVRVLFSIFGLINDKVIEARSSPLSVFRANNCPGCGLHVHGRFLNSDTCMWIHFRFLVHCLFLEACPQTEEREFWIVGFQLVIHERKLFLNQWNYCVLSLSELNIYIGLHDLLIIAIHNLKNKTDCWLKGLALALLILWQK